jgi:subfamily B ATP-binding cassette protein MsbA
MADDKKTWVIYKRLLTYVAKYKYILLVGILGTMMLAGLEAGAMYVIKPLLDEAFVNRNGRLIQWLPLLTLMAILLRSVAQFISGYCMTWVARTVVMVLRQQMFRHIVRLPSRYYDHHSSGQLLSKLLYDIDQVAVVSTDALTDLVQNGCFVIGLFVVMFCISWKFTLCYLLLVPIIAVIVKVTNKRIRRVSRTVQDNMGEMTHIAEESIDGYREVRIYGGENYEIGKFDASTLASRNNDLKVTLTKSLNVSGVQLVAAMGISLIIYLAVNPQYSLFISAGGFVSMMATMLALLKPLKTLSNVNSVIQRGMAGAQSVFDFLDIPPEVDSGTQSLTRASGNIEYRDLNFAYEGDKYVLNDINIKVQPGEVIALVGRSGSGKSTIASLLARHYNVNSGGIYLDGVNLVDLRLPNLRQQLAYVSQNVVLFNDTIANNIAYGCAEGMPREHIQKAAEAAFAHEFIKDLPKGYDTLVGDNGVLLSGGQRQRIAIARAILKDAPILILDEATSALDTESERYIQQALQHVMKNRTTLVIAHRLSTIEKATRILVLDQGRIVESGSHRELLALGGYYHKLYQMQFSENSDEQTGEKTQWETLLTKTLDPALT